MAGKEVVQVYVAPKKECNVIRPAHELKAFEKVELKPGESKKVLFTLNKKDFSYYDIGKKDFTVCPGEYDIEIAASSRDIKLTGTIRYYAD